MLGTAAGALWGGVVGWMEGGAEGTGGGKGLMERADGRVVGGMEGGAESSGAGAGGEAARRPFFLPGRL